MQRVHEAEAVASWNFPVEQSSHVASPPVAAARPGAHATQCSALSCGTALSPKRPAGHALHTESAQLFSARYCPCEQARQEPSLVDVRPSLWNVARQQVSAVHSRSEDAVEALLWYSVLVHTRRGWHTRSVPAVCRVRSNSPCLQVVSCWHWRSWTAVGATLSNSAAEHGARTSMHMCAASDTDAGAGVGNAVRCACVKPCPQ